jgi:hypothetical protein
MVRSPTDGSAESSPQRAPYPPAAHLLMLIVDARGQRLEGACIWIKGGERDTHLVCNNDAHDTDDRAGIQRVARIPGTYQVRLRSSHIRTDNDEVEDTATCRFWSVLPPLGRAPARTDAWADVYEQTLVS